MTNPDLARALDSASVAPIHGGDPRVRAQPEATAGGETTGIAPAGEGLARFASAREAQPAGKSLPGARRGQRA